MSPLLFFFSEYNLGGAWEILAVAALVAWALYPLIEDKRK